MNCAETQLLLDSIQNSIDTRRESLENEGKKTIPRVGVDESERRHLGGYLKFVNRESSINVLIKHAAKQYKHYLKKGGITEYQVQWAACSGGPGLGKTTFCRKAFTRAVDACGTTKTELWKDVPEKAQDLFLPAVTACVGAGRQYRISFGGELGLTEDELKDPTKSFAYRLTNCLTKDKYVQFEKAPALEEFLLRLTKGKKESLVVVNFDETNRLLEYRSEGKEYLMKILSSVQAFNKKQVGFLFCIMSGTNVGDLHNVLKYTSGGNAHWKFHCHYLVLTT